MADISEKKNDGNFHEIDRHFGTKASVFAKNKKAIFTGYVG
jgi:hypothetical protein